MPIPPIELKQIPFTAKEFEKLGTERFELVFNGKLWFPKMMAIASLIPKDLTEVFGKHCFVAKDCREVSNEEFFKSYKY